MQTHNHFCPMHGAGYDKCNCKEGNVGSAFIKACDPCKLKNLGFRLGFPEDPK